MAIYVRFITGEIDSESLREAGVFQVAYHLRDKGHLPDHEKARLIELLKWFDNNLMEPTRFTKSKPPFNAKKKKAISWFKDTATEHIANLREIVAILDNHNVHSRMIKTGRPGYIVYEDSHQVVAEPFSDAKF
jgi:hypothetical protein